MYDLGCSLREVFQLLLKITLILLASLEWLCELPFQVLIWFDDSYREVWFGLEDPHDIIDDYRNSLRRKA